MKRNNVIGSFIILSMLIIITCNIVRDSPLDELGKAYIPPSIIVDTLSSSVHENDTIHFDSATIVLADISYNREFKFKYSDSLWSDWTGNAYFHMENLQDTIYTINIATRYEGGEIPVYKNFSFFVLTKGYKPVFSADQKDTIIKVLPGKQLALTFSLPLNASTSYNWYKRSKSDSILTGSDTPFVVSSVSVGDTGIYYCVVTNKYGTTKSRQFIVEIDPASNRTLRIYYFSNNATNGTTPQDNNLYFNGSQVTLPGNLGTLIKNGFQFAGWMRVSGTDTSFYSSGTKVTLDTTDMAFYAWWTETSVYSVVYYGNDPTDGSAPIDKNNYITGSYVTVLGNTGYLEKTGYIFGGWSRDSLIKNRLYTAGDTAVMGSQTLRLFAVWGTKPRYNVSYNSSAADRGAPPKDDSLYYMGDIVHVKSNSGNLEKTGCTLAGWSTSTESNAKIYLSDDTILSMQSDFVLYARWSSQKMYNIIYNKNGADSGTVPIDDNNYLAGKTATIKENTGNLKKVGFTFFGWNVQADGLGATFKPNTTIETGYNNIILYAMWTTKPTYSITYIIDSSVIGTSPQDVKQYAEGDSATILQAGLINKNGYTFSGWNTELKGNGTSVNAGSKLVMRTNDIVLYAQWTINRYEVTYFSNNTVFQKDSVNHGSLLSAPPKPERLGFTFSGWYKDAQFSELWDFTSTRITRIVTLYAAWTSTFHTIQFITGTESSIPSQAIQYGGKVSIPIPAPTRIGFTLSGWIKDTATAKTWNFTSDTVVSDLTLFAKWSSKTYNVTFSFQNGQNDSTISVAHGDTIKKPVMTPAREGYTFNNWYPPQSGSIPWNFATPVTMPCSLYASWSPKTYTITFIVQNGTPATSAFDVNHGDTIVKPANPVRQGYDFDKWCADALFSTSWNFKTTITRPCTLYAQFTIKKYQVVFNTIGGSLFIPVLVNFGGTVPRPDSVPRLQGYKFDNWYQDASGSSLWNFSTTTITSPDTIYAKWTIESYRVLFDKQGGGANDSQTVIYNQKVSEPTQPEYSGYTFGGWFTDKTYAKQWAFSSDLVTAPVTLYARWLPCSFVLPEIANLTENPKLPDPFTFLNGTRMTRKSEWGCRRAEILAMASKYIYGPCPPKPDEVTGTVTGGTVTINCKVGTNTASFSASITGSGDPICLELAGGISPSSAKRLSLGSDNESKIKTLYGISEIIPGLATAWMIDRVMDVLELNPGSGYDPKKMMVSGCSGCGKSALLVGAYSRIPLTVIAESGGGGASSLRMVEWFRHGDGNTTWQCPDNKPQGIDALEDNGICGPWVATNAQWLRSATDAAKVKLLPFDQHMLIACIAPRACCHVANQNGQNEWCLLGSTCQALSAWAAEPVWNALGVPENFGFLMYTESSAPDHCSKPASATALANEFFKRIFQGDASANTNVMTIRDSDLQQPQADWPAMWKDWTTPDLQ